MDSYTLKIYTYNQEIKENYQVLANNHNNHILNKYSNAGFDLLTPHDIIYTDKNIVKLDTEIMCAMYNANNIPVSYYLYPRSSVSKTNLRLANSVGIIDSGYRGNIIGIFDVNTFNNDYHILKGSRLLQICGPYLNNFKIEIVDTIDELSEETDRGTGGFGSTGK